MSAGIYILFYEKDDGLFYIGQSIALEGRYEDHCKKLKAGSHHNTLLQQLYLKYSEYPSMYVLEYTNSDKDILDSKEIAWVSTFDSFNNGMNETIGGGGLGYGENHPNSKLTDQEYYTILHTLATSGKSISEVSKQLNVPIGIVHNISSGTTHRWLNNIFPELYLAMQNREKRKSGCNDLAARGIQYPPIVSPEGIKYIVTNIRAFAKEHSLLNQDLGKVLRGDRKSTKGWKLANHYNI